MVIAKASNFKSERFKLAVLDANFYWTEQLFSACRDFADVLLLCPHDFRAFRQLYGSYFTDWQPQAITEGVWHQRICCPPGWLFHYWFLTNYFFATSIRQFQGDNPLIFVFNYPYYYSLAKELKAISIYYCVDDYQNYWYGRQKQTKLTEDKAVATADLTLCVSNYRANYFRKEFPQKANSIIHIPHGCSPAFMVEQPLFTPKSLPEELISYSRPIAGYVGALNYRFDFAYLAKVAVFLKEVTFILGGDLPKLNDGDAGWWEGVEQVRSLSNIYFIGRVSHHRLGEYLQSFDVLLMIYSKCEFNLNSCPTKLWDYMGTSLPIVANDLVPEVNFWSNVILISHNPEEFTANVRRAIDHPNKSASEQLKVAKQNTWNYQADNLKRHLENIIGQI